MHSATPPASSTPPLEGATPLIDGGLVDPQLAPQQQPDADLAPTENPTKIPPAIPSWLFSSLLHLIVLLMMAVISFPEQFGTGGLLVVGQFSTGDAETGPLSELAPVSLPATSISSQDLATPQLEPLSPATSDESNTPPPIQTLQPLTNELSPLAEVGITTSQFIDDPGHGMNMSGLEGRTGGAKQALLESGGGTPGTEKAVQLALQWLAQHQNADGSWSFQPGDGSCGCPNLGDLRGNSNAATALALLPFLGAGHTHQEGEYREVVKQGLYYLRNVQTEQGSFWEEGGRMYSHGLASIALCEAYAMTKDRGLQAAAQRSLDFISSARDPSGGGWRYTIAEPGDTSVTGWIVMALKSGRMGYLSIPHETVEGTRRFFDSVQSNAGATYGYRGPGDKPSMTAVGLLCRMYMGWSQDNPSLERGVEILAKIGPSKDDIYYDYYATQVMRHYGSASWDKWNQRMRGFLVSSQNKYGHAAGSWFFPNDLGAQKGGRLYCTAMAAMILEVYYRHLPIYGEHAANDHFPL